MDTAGTAAGGTPVKGVVLVQTDDSAAAELREALTARPELEIVAEVTSTLEAVAVAGRARPGVLVLDVGLKDLAGHGVLRSVRAVSPATRIVLHARATRTDEAPGTARWIARLVDVVVDPVRAAALNARLVLSDDNLSVPLARGFVGDLLEQWDLGPLVDSAQLLASELVANAVVHVSGPCALELTHHDEVLNIAVADSGRGMPDLQVLGPMSENGRGLHIISAFSTAWGVDHLDDGGKLVWAELAPLAVGVT
jgi:CheY-like chemotaxis protein/anti-sigma regulatory factor (Ser/Thr protein kinase)